MLDAFITGLLLVFEWPAIGYLLLGILTGIWLGAVPGLGGVIGLVILLPFTFGMETVSAFALLIRLQNATHLGSHWYNFAPSHNLRARARNPHLPAMGCGRDRQLRMPAGSTGSSRFSND